LNQQPYRFVFIDDEARKAELDDIDGHAMQELIDRPRIDAPRTDAAEDNVDRTTKQQQHVAESVFYLRDHLDEVAVLCIPLVAGRTDGLGVGARRPDVGVFWQAGLDFKPTPRRHATEFLCWNDFHS
jgi:hypothetical protein